MVIFLTTKYLSTSSNKEFNTKNMMRIMGNPSPKEGKLSLNETAVYSSQYYGANTKKLTSQCKNIKASRLDLQCMPPENKARKDPQVHLLIVLQTTQTHTYFPLQRLGQMNIPSFWALYIFDTEPQSKG